MNTTTCTCGKEYTLGYRVITRGDGSPDLGSARARDNGRKGVTCRACALARVKTLMYR